MAAGISGCVGGFLMCVGMEGHGRWVLLCAHQALFSFSPRTCPSLAFPSRAGEYVLQSRLSFFLSPFVCMQQTLGLCLLLGTLADFGHGVGWAALLARVILYMYDYSLSLREGGRGALYKKVVCEGGGAGDMGNV